jgi:uncharacterized membrane protein YfcA
MPEPRYLLLGALAVFGLIYIIGWVLMARRATAETGQPEVRPAANPGILNVVIGAVTNFFDTLGIGSFAPTTAIFRLKRIVPDKLIPGTLNVGHTLPTIVQAFIFIALVQVEMPTLVAMIAAAVVGAWLGAGVVAKWPKRRIQAGMGIALLVAATLFVASNLGLMPGGGTDGTFALTGMKFYLGIAGNFVLGALMTLGIGLYAPCMLLVAMLGMNPTAAFPIMMGSCAFLMPVASLRFIKEKSYSFRPSLGLALGGIPAVLVAALIVKSLDVKTVRWLVVVVVLYTAVTLLRAAMAREPEPRTPVKP